MRQERMIRRNAIAISVITLILIGVSFTYYTGSLIDSIETEIEDLITSKNTLKIQYDADFKEILEDEWRYYTVHLRYAIQSAGIIGQDQTDKIEHDLLQIDNLKEEFNSFNEDGNVIASILDKHTRDTYFMVPNDANDPFIIIVTIEGEIIIAVDTSINCAILNEDGEPQRTRTLEEEYKQQTHKELAEYQLPRIANHAKWSLENPLYFQFTGSEPLPLNSFDLLGIKEIFMDTGSWRDAFRDIEFLVPTYLYDDRDILGQKRVDSRGFINNDTKIIIYVMAFNFYDYIENDPKLKEDISVYDTKEKLLLAKYESDIELVDKSIEKKEATIKMHKLARFLLNIIVLISALVMYAILKE